MTAGLKRGLSVGWRRFGSAVVLTAGAVCVIASAALTVVTGH